MVAKNIVLGSPGTHVMYMRVKDTHREKASSNKTPALTNMGIWVVGTSN